MFFLTVLVWYNDVSSVLFSFFLKIFNKIRPHSPLSGIYNLKKKCSNFPTVSTNKFQILFRLPNNLSVFHCFDVFNSLLLPTIYFMTSIYIIFAITTHLRHLPNCLKAPDVFRKKNDNQCAKLSKKINFIKL